MIPSKKQVITIYIFYLLVMLFIWNNNSSRSFPSLLLGIIFTNKF
ncbi:SVM family protein [Carnobacterium maltaromaticum]